VSTFVLERVFPCRLFFSKCFFDIIKSNRTLANSNVPRHLILSSQDRYCLSLQSIRYILSIYIQKYSTKRIRLETNQKSDVRIINLVFVHEKRQLQCIYMPSSVFISKKNKVSQYLLLNLVRHQREALLSTLINIE
jgi:hypothetical protein